MTRSLAEDLRVLAHSGRGADDAHPGAMIADGAGHLVRQIRRRRAARQTGMGAIGVTAVAAVALGGTQGPGWFALPGDGSPGEGPSVTPTVEPTEGPTTTPTPSPTDEPTADPTADPTSGSGGSTTPPAPGTLSPGLQLVADTYGLDLSCGAPLTYQVIEAAGGRGADHLTPSIAVDPTRADQALTVINGIPDDGEIMDGYARTTPVVVVARDGMVVGWGGGGVVLPKRANVVMGYEIELDRLHQCADPAMAADGLGTYTLWVMASESGFGLPEDVEGLSFAAGLRFDLATGAWDYDVGAP
jgi:hypothetical protein